MKERLGFRDYGRFTGLWDSLLPKEDTIELTEIEPGVFRKPEPHEDIHHPDYFDALKERNECQRLASSPKRN